MKIVYKIPKESLLLARKTIYGIFSTLSILPSTLNMLPSTFDQNSGSQQKFLAPGGGLPYETDGDAHRKL